MYLFAVCFNFLTYNFPNLEEGKLKRSVLNSDVIETENLYVSIIYVNTVK